MYSNIPKSSKLRLRIYWKEPSEHRWYRLGIELTSSLVNTLEKNWFSMLAFSLSELLRLPSLLTDHLYRL